MESVNLPAAGNVIGPVDIGGPVDVSNNFNSAPQW